MWTAKNRGRYDGSALRYPSDLTDDEWALVEPLIPPAKRGGNKRHVDVREVMNGMMYILSTGCQWRAIPKDLPPRSTVHDYLDLWSYDGTLYRIHHMLYVECREQGGREASPTAAIIDSQSVKSAEKGGACIDPHGYDAGKKIKGKKRHLLVDTLGLLLHAIVHPADIQDRDGGILLLATLFGMYPFTYGADFPESFRQAAGYIDRILKGAKPAELPIQLPTKFELVINMKTAKALKLDVALSLQQIADEVIE